MRISEVRYAERYVNRALARALYGEDALAYARFQFEADPLADAVAEAMRAAPELRLAFDQAVRQGIETVDAPPACLRALFAEVDAVPAWADFDRMNLGARTYRRMGMLAVAVLSSWALMNGYHSAAAVKPLAFTGQLGERAPRRLAETGRYITEVVQHDAMRRCGRGFQLALRVRLMHAQVRGMIRASGRWNDAAFGAPINQADMFGTLIEFSLLVLEGGRQLGFHFTEEESEALIHLWRYNGFLQGVTPPLLAHLRTEAAGVRMARLLRLVQAGPDADSIALAQALREVPMKMAKTRPERWVARFRTRMHDGLTWAFNGNQIASDLKIPHRSWRHVIVPTRLGVQVMEGFRRSLPGGTLAADWVGNTLVRREIRAALAGLEPSFRARRTSGA